MSYTKTTWETGDTITAEKLNNIEDGVEAASSGSGGPLIVSLNTEGLYRFTDATFEDISEAFLNGRPIIWVDEESYDLPQVINICAIALGNAVGFACTIGTNTNNVIAFIGNSKDDYPVQDPD